VLISFLRNRQGVRREFPLYERRIDVATIDSETNELWTIEAKTSNWKKAISQAIVNLAAGERSYIAIYADNAHRVSDQLLEEHGIGLIAVGTSWGDVEIVKQARLSAFTNKIALGRIKAAILNGSI